MPTLNVVSIGQYGAQYYVSELSSDWNQSNYAQMYLCYSPASSSGTSGVASLNPRSETWVQPPVSGTARTTTWGSISGLSASTTYTFYANIQAQNGLWYPAGSRTFTTAATPPPIPSTPTGLSKNEQDGHVVLSWNAMSYATSYEIRWSPDNLTGSNSNVSGYAGYDLVNLQNGVTYTVQVYSVNNTGKSSPATITVTPKQSNTPANAPNVSAYFTNLQAYVSWGAVSGSQPMYYEIAKKKSIDSTWVIWQSQTTSTGSYVDVDDSNTNYDFRVKAFNSYGSSPYGYAYNIRSGVPAATVPEPIPPPIGLIRQNPNGTKLEYFVSFNGVGAPRYTVTAQLASGGLEVVKYDGAWATPVVEFDQQNTEYIVRVRACNAAGCSSPLATTFITGSLVTAPQGAPSVSASYVFSGGIHYVNVNWSDVTNATYYKIYANDGTSGDVLKNGNATGNSAQITVDKADTTYTIKVQACNSVACASVSGSTTIKTVARPPLFNWTTAKTANGLFNLTAAEWNALTGNIDALRQSKNMTPYGFTNAITGGVVGAYMFNQVVNAINVHSPPTAPPPTRSVGDPITAAHLNQIVSSLNSIP